MKTDGYQPRVYRHWIEGRDLKAFTVSEKETDLYLRATSNLQKKARRLVLKYRKQLEQYIQKNPTFLTSLEPFPTTSDAPRLVLNMIEAGRKANVGPMAAVAGAIAEAVGRELLDFSPEIIVENGGDIFLKITRKRIIGIYAGNSPLTGKIGLEISPNDTPLGVCTSSGTVGHSLSYGKADAVITTAVSAALADAAATAVCNIVKKPEDISNGIELGRKIPGLKGIIVIIGESISAWGDITFCETSI
jgi:ApbE superfamily uncharacterized protein (UPF0280 family)